MANPAQSDATPKVNEISEITLERSVCFGSCPSYKVTFYKNGTATYIGEAYTPLMGTYEADRSSCPACYFTELANWIDLQQFSNLQAIYEKGKVDASVTTIRVVRGNDTKTVISYNPTIPLELWGIAMAIDGVVSKLKWKKVTNNSKPTNK